MTFSARFCHCLRFVIIWQTLINKKIKFYATFQITFISASFIIHNSQNYILQTIKYKTIILEMKQYCLSINGSVWGLTFCFLNIDILLKTVDYFQITEFLMIYFFFIFEDSFQIFLSKYSNGKAPSAVKALFR